MPTINVCISLGTSRVTIYGKTVDVVKIKDSTDRRDIEIIRGEGEADCPLIYYINYIAFTLCDTPLHYFSALVVS